MKRELDKFIIGNSNNPDEERIHKMATTKKNLVGPLPPALASMIEPSNNTVTIGGKMYVKEPIRLSPWKFQPETPKYAKFLTAALPRQSTNRDNPEENKTRYVAMVEDLETGTCFELTAGAVLLNTLNERFPEGSYVGKSFELIQHDVPGKAWKAYSVNLLKQ